MNTLQEKKLQLLQKNNFKNRLKSLDYDLESLIISPIYFPEASDIIRKLFEKKMILDIDAKKYVTRDAGELLSLVNTFQLSFTSSQTTLLTLPGVLKSGNYYSKTVLPVIKISSEQINKFYYSFCHEKLFDFFSACTLDYSSGLLIDSYADFPCEENGFFDGAVYEIYSW